LRWLTTNERTASAKNLILDLEKRFRNTILFELQANTIDKKEIDPKQVLTWLTRDHDEAMRICRDLQSKYDECLMQKADGANKDETESQTREMSRTSAVVGS
jgi:hypothetical protein